MYPKVEAIPVQLAVQKTAVEAAAEVEEDSRV